MRSSTKTKIFVVVAVLLAGILLVAFGKITGGFQNLSPDEWVFREVNEDNLFQTVAFGDVDGTIENGANGVTVKLTEDNALKIEGTAETDLSITIGTFTAEADTTYVFDTSLSKSTNGTIYITVGYGFGDLGLGYGESGTVTIIIYYEKPNAD